MRADSCCDPVATQSWAERTGDSGVGSRMVSSSGSTVTTEAELAGNFTAREGGAGVVDRQGICTSCLSVFGAAEDYFFGKILTEAV